MFRIGMDVGGTFTDLILLDEKSGEVWSLKVPTTPKDPSVGILDGVRRLLDLSGVRADQIRFVGQGTTIATNMVIEGEGARTGLLTTKGFRDIIEIRRSSRHDRADLYDIMYENPPPLAQRRHRLEVDERILYDGSVQTPLDVDQVRRQARELAHDGVESIAICFVNSYVNSAHERAALEACREAAPGLFLTASYEVNPELGEYERTSTTVMNGLLGPRCGGYIGAFESKLRDEGISADLYLMQSNGGLTKPAIAAARPVALLESGPAGGVTAVTRLCEQLDRPNALLGDMGGTSFDVSLVRDSKPELRSSMLLDSYTVRCPSIDIVSIGAGGGSIAWIDEGGGVHIGPESAGADPGPVCYGRGGKRPTVTDCNLILGYLDPDGFLGGEFRLDVAAAERAIDEQLAKPLGTTRVEAARIVREVTNALMAQAIRLVTIERGYDPRDFIYVPYGGAGPVHAIDLALALDIPQVVVPPLPGLLSATGMLVADLLHDAQAPVMEVAQNVRPDELARLFDELEQAVMCRLREAGVAAKDVEIRRTADCRYVSQGDSIAVALPGGTFGADAVERLTADFEAEHQRLWNFTMPGTLMTILNVRLQAVGKVGIRRLPKSDPHRGTAAAASRKRRIFSGGDFIEVPCVQRRSLQQDKSVKGPLLVEEHSSSFFVHAGQVVHADAHGNIIIDLGAPCRG